MNGDVHSHVQCKEIPQPFPTFVMPDSWISWGGRACLLQLQQLWPCELNPCKRNQLNGLEKNLPYISCKLANCTSFSVSDRYLCRDATCTHLQSALHRHHPPLILVGPTSLSTPLKPATFVSWIFIDLSSRVETTLLAIPHLSTSRHDIFSSRCCWQCSQKFIIHVRLRDLRACGRSH